MKVLSYNIIAIWKLFKESIIKGLSNHIDLKETMIAKVLSFNIVMKWFKDVTLQWQCS